MNSSYSGSTYDVVPGIGLNLSNALPTTSLNQLAKGMNPPLKDFTPEKLLASILAHFEVSRFVRYRNALQGMICMLTMSFFSSVRIDTVLDVLPGRFQPRHGVVLL